MAITLAFWWLKFGPTGNTLGGGGVTPRHWACQSGTCWDRVYFCLDQKLTVPRTPAVGRR